MEDSDSLRGKVLSWLDKQGYPLEMRVAAGLRSKTSFQVRQGWHYADAETNQSREIDIVATASEHIGLASVHFSFECKGTTKPWVLFTSEHTTRNYNRLTAFSLTSAAARDVIAPALFPLNDEERASAAHEACKKLPWIWDEPAVGYTLAQVFDGSNDVPYAATTSVVKAALRWFADSPEHNAPPPIVASFPVVVTTSPLFECYLDEKNQTQLREIERGFLFYQRRIGDMSPVQVAIVAESGLSRFIDECVATSEILMGVFEPRVRIMWNEMKKR